MKIAGKTVPALSRPLLGAWLFLLAVGVLHVVAVFTENVNWDEFALLDRAVRTLHSGQIQGGGRPGLATVLLLPLAAACHNAVETVVHARLLWLVPVFGAIAALALNIHLLLPASPRRRMSVTAGVALWALAPYFLRYSVQVRADQPALFLGLLGGAASLASLRHPLLATLGGASLGAGFLFSQKAAYVGLLIGALAVGQLLLARDFQTRRELLRLLLFAGCFLAVVVGYRVALGMLSQPPSVLPIEGALSAFDYYREFVGWHYYRRMVPTLLPQLLVIAGLIVLTATSSTRDTAYSRNLLAAWLVLGSGAIVLLFHAGRFPYFYMTIGLFPAAIGGLILEPSLAALKTPLLRRLVTASVGVPLALTAAAETILSMQNSQEIQRRSLDFIDRSFASEARGFEGRAALTCRRDPDPFPVHFNQHIVTQFTGEAGSRRARDFMDEFRNRPVSFMIVPTGPYPDEVREFWRRHYVQYRAAVWIPGRRIALDHPSGIQFEIIVPGRYRWHSATGARLFVDGRVVPPGGVIELAPGAYTLRVEGEGQGVFALHVPLAPARDTRTFYRQY